MATVSEVDNTDQGQAFLDDAHRRVEEAEQRRERELEFQESRQKQQEELQEAIRNSEQVRALESENTKLQHVVNSLNTDNNQLRSRLHGKKGPGALEWATLGWALMLILFTVGAFWFGVYNGYEARHLIDLEELRYDIYYETLGLPTNSSYEELKVRWQQLIRDSHPDKNPDADPARYTNIGVAYEVLQHHLQPPRQDVHIDTDTVLSFEPFYDTLTLAPTATCSDAAKAYMTTVKDCQAGDLPQHRCNNAEIAWHVLKAKLCPAKAPHSVENTRVTELEKQVLELSDTIHKLRTVHRPAVVHREEKYPVLLQSPALVPAGVQALTIRVTKNFLKSDFFLWLRSLFHRPRHH